jgi:outer membrane protein OmpA-like peptidoglycan-associated protein
MKLIPLSLLAFLLVISHPVNGQDVEVITIKKKEFKTSQKEGLKEAWKSIREGDKYYDMGVGSFDLARDHYLFADQYNSDNAALNYKIGICYLYGDDKYKAIDYLLKAYQIDPEVSPEIHYVLGRAYHLVLEFDRAKEHYATYKKSLSIEDGDRLAAGAAVDKLVVECTHGKELMADPKRVIIQNLGEEINSRYDDYNPRFAYQDSALFFTSRRPVGKRPARNPIDNKFNEDIYISSVHGLNFGPARYLGKPFSGKGNDAIVGVAPDGSVLFVYRGDVDGGDIQMSEYDLKKMKWKKPKSFSKKIGSDASETTAAMTPDGNTIYFISSDEELTRGGKDIMVSRKNHKGKWEEPNNLSSLLNTKYDEEGVYLSGDGNTLYFSSKGHNTMGGFDVFMCTKGEDGYWSVPENLGYPINTPDDEVFYMTDTSSTYGYYSAIREGGLGGKDIYKIITLGSEKEMTTLPKDQLIAGIEIEEKVGFFTYPQRLQLDTSLIMTGRVRDTIGTDTTVMAGLTFMDPSTGEVVARAMTGVDGVYRARLPQPKIYGIEINATGYLYYLDIADLSGLNPDEPAEQDFFLQKIEVGTKVVLDNIYFETGKSVLTTESYESLDQVYRFLDNNPTVRLEISGHTDNTGSLRVNTSLSQARAKAVVDYLVGRGLDRGRFEYKGYADTQPIADNSTAEGREMNRRVEFKVLSK